MAASMPWLPFPFGPQIPVTPPPDHQSFSLSQPPSLPPPPSPQLLKSFTQELYGSGSLGSGLGGLGGGISGGIGGLKTVGLQTRMMTGQRAMPGSVAAGVAGKTVLPPPPPPWQRQQNKQQQQSNVKPEPAEQGTASSATATEPATIADSTGAATASTGHNTAATAETAATTAASEGLGSAADPRYLAMASRIAAYYHQRCQAVANFQQQRCQAWANMQRQKSQEMTQAAMLVVAWYIRDRIQRRRRRQKRQFRRGLAAKANMRSAAAAAAAAAPGAATGHHHNRATGAGGGGRVTKGEAVRKWVLQIPEGSAALSPSAAPGARDRPADPDEMSFDIDRDTVSDKDTRLYNVADNLIKSQLARIDVPLMGAISFDASESESDEEEEEEEEDDDDGDDDEPVGPGAVHDDDVMVNYYEERGAPIGAMVAAGAARAGLGAGALAEPVTGNTNHDGTHNNNTANKNTAGAIDEDDEEYYMEDDDDDDYDFEDDDDEEEDDEEVSELVHHGTGGRVSRQQTSSFS